MSIDIEPLCTVLDVVCCVVLTEKDVSKPIVIRTLNMGIRTSRNPFGWENQVLSE